GDGGVPYRIDVRRMLPPRGEAPEEESALYDVRVRQRCGPAGSGGDGDRPEAEMVLAGCVDVSPYAELAGDEAQRITGAARHYILASPGVREIEIRSEIDATLIAIYNRLDALPRQVRLPAPSDPCERGGWDWFPRYPDNTAQWEARRKLRSLRIQPAPPADAAGGEPRYSLWRRVAPVWPRETLDLLVPWIRAPGGERPAAGDYLELPLGREETVRVAGGAGAAEARPRIIALDPFGGGGELSAEVDRRIVFSTELRGRVGLFRLPSVPSGIHSLRVDAPEGVRVFASGLSSEDGPAYRRLSATPIGGGRVSCDVIKESAGEEMLIARVFLEESVQGPVDLCAEIRLLEPKGEGPFQSWTFLRHQVSLEAAGEAGAFLLRREGIALREAEPLTIELGEDLPPGLYRVEFHFSAAARGCVRLSQGRKEPRPFGSVTRMVSLERGDEPEIDGDG
ncbi:MAG: hypothetical protein JXA90_00440, partial [Planctomycetes bacterium]|nr:hypothetical protein [Planctomycetota bacterium]